MTGPKLANVIHAGIVPLFFSLAGCDLHQMPKTSRFCVEEKREIPDGELKVRLLLDMEKKGRRLPNYIIDYGTKMSGSPIRNNEWKKNLVKFVHDNPLCCQLIEEDLRYPKQNFYDERYHGDSDTWENAFEKGYFANFYVQTNIPYVQLFKFGRTQNNIKIDGVISGGAYNCGKVRTMDYIFG